MKKSILFWFLLVPVLSYSQIQVQTNGLSNQIVISPDESLVLRGTILSLINQHPLPFVSVSLIQNGKTITKGQTDFDGNYLLKNIPPGTYTLKAFDHDSKECKTLADVRMVKETTLFIDIKLATTHKPTIAVCCSKPNINDIPNQKLDLNSIDTLLPSYQLINNPLESSITIYPNPSSGLVKVTNPLTTKSFALYDLSGKIVFEQTSFNQKNLTLDITTYQKGMYILKIEDEQGVQIHQIIRN